MKVKNRGIWGYRQDDAGQISGIWVENLALAQLDDDYKPNLRMLLSWMCVDPSTGITDAQCSAMYEAIDSNELYVRIEEPCEGGGFWITKDEEPENEQPRAQRPWWRLW